MIYSIEEYASKFFNGNESDVARYHSAGCKHPSATVGQWKRAGDKFVVCGVNHIRFNPKNMTVFDEGVKQ